MKGQRRIRTLSGLLARPLIAVVLLLAVAPVPSLGRSAKPSAERSAVAAARPVVGEIARLAADDVEAMRQFGVSVDVSGDTIVVGAPWDGDSAHYAGAAYVFVRNYGGADGWGQIKNLTAHDAEASGQFGQSVAISGDTIAVGASGASSYAGKAYVFERNEGGRDQWGHVADLVPADPLVENDRYGWSVAISGDTVIVGSFGDDGGAGAAYVFERNQDGVDSWGQVAELVPTTPHASAAHFGASVAISGGTVVVGASADGAHYSGSAYVFERNVGGDDHWGEVKKIVGVDTTDYDHFGIAVDVHVDTAVVGAHYDDDGGDAAGSAYVFERNQDGLDEWGQVRKLTAPEPQSGDNFGTAVAIYGEGIMVGAPGAVESGRAHVFLRNEGGADHWEPVAEAVGSDTGKGDSLGEAVAMDGHTAVVGAPWTDMQGAAYAFARRGAEWREEKKTIGDDTTGGDQFGHAVGISADTLVAGAPLKNNRAGAAYVFTRNQGGADWWGQMERLPIGSDPGDLLGAAVDIDGDRLVVGAPGLDWAYVCERNEGVADAWGIARSIDGSLDGAPGDWFGGAVAISGDTVVVGAPYANAGAGVAHIYVRNRGGADMWGYLTTIDARGFAQDNDLFGGAVAISGDTLVVGAPLANPTGKDNAGAAYVFRRNFEESADVWAMVRALTAGDGAAGDRFGWSVAIDNDTILVGAPYATVGEDYAGAAYVFERNTVEEDGWGQVRKLSSSNPGERDYFAHSVAIHRGMGVVGAYLDDTAAGNAGAAHVFERNVGGADAWGHAARITAEDAAAADSFGIDVSIGSGIIAVGARDAGAAYVYRWHAARVYLPLTLRVN